MIHVSCHDFQLCDRIREALEPMFEVVLLDTHAAALAAVREDDSAVSVIGISSADPAEEDEHVSSIVWQNTSQRIMLGVCPLVFVEGGGQPRRRLPSSLGDVPLANTIISASDVLEHLTDAIRQECSRAALASVRHDVRATFVLPPTLKRAMLQMCDTGFCTSVKAMAARGGHSPSTLRRQWRNAVGHDVSLKRFITICAVLGVRARKSPRTTWKEACASSTISPRHIRDALARYLPVERKAREIDRWLGLSQLVRRESGKFFPSAM